MIPYPMAVRQRRRVAMNWIIDSASKKRSKIPHRGSFAVRIADELIAIVEGRSSLWDRRVMVHKQGVLGRSNIRNKPRIQRR